MLEHLARLIKATNYDMYKLSELPITVPVANELFDKGLIDARYADALAQIFDPSYDY